MEKVQTISRKCCNTTYAACIEPHCYIDKDWLKDLRKSALRGDIVQMVESKDFAFRPCQCKSKETDSQPNLFNSSNIKI